MVKLQVDESREFVTIWVICRARIWMERLRLRDEWTVNAKFGRQFRFESCLSVLPSTVTGIEKYRDQAW